jgi:predicted DNA-binding transcriptional regulator AlpA
MKELMSIERTAIPMLLPYDPEKFWQSIRLIVREEISALEKQLPVIPLCETPGMTSKPLYKIAEVCTIFQVTKPTIYDWVKHGKLKPFKIQSRVYFLSQDIERLMKPAGPK